MNETKYVIQIIRDGKTEYVAPGKLYKENGKSLIPVTDDINKAKLFKTYNGASIRSETEAYNLTGDIKILAVNAPVIEIVEVLSQTPKTQIMAERTENMDKEYNAMLSEVTALLQGHCADNKSAKDTIKAIRRVVKSRHTQWGTI